MVPPPEKGSGNGEGERDEEPRDDTQEFALPEDTGEDLPPESVAEDDEGDDDTDDVDDSPGPETELEEIINAETQEWDGIDPDDDASDDEDFDDEPAHDDADQTLVQSARSTITSGFEAVGGPKVTSGFKAVGKKMRFPMWARFMTASLLIVASVAAATSASLLLYLSDIADALDPDKEFAGITDRLQGVEGGEPQTIMILGSDKRPELKGDGFRGLSDTTMLLRVDPDENALALFSLPRDLRVDIPGYGSDKLNAAYAYGGPELTLRTVQQLTETPDTPNGLEINHVVNIDFEGFARAVNEIDCVYVDVDRRYFNTNDDLGRQRLRGDRHSARLPGAVRVRRARLRPLSPHRQRRGARRPPAGLPARGAPEGAARGAVRRAQGPHRRLHQAHDLGHRQRRRHARGPEALHRGPRRAP